MNGLKKISLILVFLLAAGIANTLLFAETKTAIATANFEATDIFSLEFYIDQNVLYTANVPFTTMDPTRTWVESDGREIDSNKSDVGLLCRTNQGEMWYLKIEGSAGSLITIGNIKYGLWQPWNRTRGQPADGIVAGGVGWHDIPTAATVAYTAGPNDLNNLSYGTLCTFSFAINPGGLDPTQVHYCTISYTLTTSLTPS